MFKKVSPVTSKEVDEGFNIFKLQVSLHELGWYNPDQESHVETYITQDNQKFSFVLILRKADTGCGGIKIHVRLLNIYLGDDARESSAKMFIQFVISERLQNIQLDRDMFRLQCESDHRDLVTALFDEAYPEFKKDSNDDLELVICNFPQDKNTLPSAELPQGYVIQPSISTHRDMILSLWMRSINVGINGTHVEIFRDIMLKDLASKRPCFSIIHDSEPVAWIKSYFDGSIGSLYVLKEHRGKGLARILIRSIVKAFMNACGAIPYANILSENSPSINLFISEGFSKHPIGITSFYQPCCAENGSRHY